MSSILNTASSISPSLSLSLFLSLGVSPFLSLPLSLSLHYGELHLHYGILHLPHIQRLGNLSDSHPLLTVLSQGVAGVLSTSGQLMIRFRLSLTVTPKVGHPRGQTRSNYRKSQSDQAVVDKASTRECRALWTHSWVPGLRRVKVIEFSPSKVTGTGSVPAVKVGSGVV